MEYRYLGNSWLRVSAVGLGCMGMSHAYGAPAGHREMTELLAQAVDLGYTLFDTAESYGTEDNPHDNEELVGEALRPYRDRIVLSTKFGISFDTESGKVPYPLITDSRPETIRRSLEGSLRRLHTDHIDIYWQHRVDTNVPVEEVAEVMNSLIREGKIAQQCDRTFPAFLVLGIGLLLTVQALFNMMVAVGLAPVTGQPLPLISRGGTSTLINCVYIGMLLSVSRYTARLREQQLHDARIPLTIEGGGQPEDSPLPADSEAQTAAEPTAQALNSDDEFK